MKSLDVAYSWLLRGANSLQSPFLLAVRLYCIFHIMRNTLLITSVLLGLGYALAQSGSYPKPQIPEATGKPAPDFSLKDQNGATFRLSEQRGTWVLLYFYRGYW